MSWRVQALVDGRMKQTTFRHEKAARQFAAQVERTGWDAARKVLDARQGRNPETMPTLAEFTDRYLDASSGLLSGVTDGTRAGYRRAAALSFLQVLGEMPLDMITRPDVSQWVVWQERQPSRRVKGAFTSAKTVRNYHGLLSSILTAATREGIIPANQAKGVKLTRGRRQGVTFLTQDEFDTVALFIPPRYLPFARFLFWTGLRFGEATALTWGDIDDSGPAVLLRVNKAWKKGPTGTPVLGVTKTSRSDRTVAVPHALLTEWGPRGAGDELVFTGANGGRLWSERFYSSAWKPAVAAANDPERTAAFGRKPIGKQPRVHDLRHSHASLLIAQGASLPLIQARLGHEKITTTIDVYGHLMPDAHLEMASMISNVLPSIAR